MKKLTQISRKLVIGGALLAVALTVSQTGRTAKENQVIPEVATAVSVLAQIIPSSTVPSNGDVNPYGVAFVPSGFPQGGAAVPGDILVSNFNNQSNLQGAGTTIVRRAQDGQTSLFFQGASGLGSADLFRQHSLARAAWTGPCSGWGFNHKQRGCNKCGPHPT